MLISQYVYQVMSFCDKSHVGVMFCFAAELKRKYLNMNMNTFSACQWEIARKTYPKLSQHYILQMAKTWSVKTKTSSMKKVEKNLFSHWDAVSPYKSNSFIFSSVIHALRKKTQKTHC